MSSAETAWARLPDSWQVAFEEAWTSWKSGSAGVGSVVTDSTGAIISRGRSRVFDTPDGLSPLAGTFMAHAEMNALACLPRGDYAGYTLVTTFEPCLMCAGTIRLYQIPHVAYAANDPVWTGLHETFLGVPAIARQLATRSCLGGPFGVFAHILHLSFLVETAPPNVTEAHLAEMAQFAVQVNESNNLRVLADEDATVVDALTSVWDEVVAVSAS